MNIIHAKQISFTFPNGRQLFNRLNLSLGSEKSGLVGNNGIGKSTLLRLLAGNTQPTSGVVNISGIIGYLSQLFIFPDNTTVSDALDMTQKLEAFDRITRGDHNDLDLEILGSDWNIIERIQKQLHSIGLKDIPLDRDIKTLSGGEITRVMLAKILLQNPDYLILDEPTNNLDHHSRQILFNIIKHWKNGLLIVSHDRTLLSLMDQIIELSTLGIKIYGGNYPDYLAQKKIKQNAASRHFHDAQKTIKKIKHDIQKSREKQQKKAKYGKQKAQKKGMSKVEKTALKERSGQTNKALQFKEQRKLEHARQQLSKASEKIDIVKKMHIDLAATEVPQGKIILNIKDLTFSYPQQARPIVKNFNLTLTGPKRIAITGPNGSGKTTLLKLIMGKLTPTFGSIHLGTKQITYLDQHLALLDLDRTILENFENHSPNLSPEECRNRLGAFLFRGETVSNIVGNLSGGEKLRVALACILLGKNSTQLLILDEPTNHMDLESIAILEYALNEYKGAIIVVSHDRFFLDNLKLRAYPKIPPILKS